MVEQVVIDTSGETEGPSLEEQSAAMDAELEPQGDGDRPEWLPEKFNSAEDMAKAYSELEGRLGSNGEAEEAEEEKIREDLENAGVDYDALSQEFWGNGELSDKSYERLEQAGIPRSIVDSYVEAQLNMVENQRGDVMNEVGGPEGYEQLTEWAADNLDDSEIDYFNNVMDSNDFRAISMTVKAIAARRDASEGMEPTRNLSGSLTGGGGGSYESVTQMMADMQSPAYAADPAFRAKVEAKLSRSNIM